MSFSSDQSLLINQLPVSLDLPQDNKLFLEALTIRLKRITQSVNRKEGSLYLLQELANFQQFFQYSVPATFTVDANNIRFGYRTTFDLVALKGGPIPPGVTTLTLTTTTTPPLINGILTPTEAHGAATIAGSIYVFFNGTDVNVEFDNTVPTAQVITITNNTGTDLIQAYWVMNYLKNN